MPSNHSPVAKTILAFGGIGVLVALAAAEKYLADSIGGTRGLYAAVLLAGAVFGGCGLARSMRPAWRPRMARPAPVRLPDPAADTPEPARAA